MPTIIPSTDNAKSALQDLLDTMLERTGGESGRDFTPNEKRAWEALLEARAWLNIANETRWIDDSELARSTADAILGEACNICHRREDDHEDMDHRFISIARARADAS